MKRLFVSTLALCLAATTGLAAAQTYSAAPYNAPPANVRYDYARVLRVDPVFDSGNGSGYATSNSQRCYQRNTVVRGDDSYATAATTAATTRRYSSTAATTTVTGNDGYYDQYGNYQRNAGTQTGATMATVIGGIVGAAIGSQVGGGSARYATSAIGSMVGGMAGRQIYEQRQRARAGSSGHGDRV
jgi:uncharacterized protein YcfJ